MVRLRTRGEAAREAACREELQHSELWNNENIRRSVLRDALPKLLLDKIGLDTIMQRVPETYLRSIFGSYLASRFVYQDGSEPSQFAFYDLWVLDRAITPPPSRRGLYPETNHHDYSLSKRTSGL